MDAVTSLPPGPRLPRWMQTLGFSSSRPPGSTAAHRRYGDVVTFRSLFDPQFVMVFDAHLVKQVFRGSPDRLHAGEANALLGPVVGERSVLLLDGAEHLRQRKLLLPPFHGERMRAYAERDGTRPRTARSTRWPRGRAVRAARADAGAHARGHPARGVRRHATRRAAASFRAASGR